ncbi:MAG TPA: hypothetical protein PK668_25475 [Myxococcota bacterium]|nr:hypothetical protein [Myxococcota bacterium]HRY95226.1 hypothetical protein [Myxococcota bacterium]HSA23530.1 hypothetical protein [Myxococcota bacterium]
MRNLRGTRLLALAALVLTGAGARAQTVVELDLSSAAQLLDAVGKGKAMRVLSRLANNERQLTNVRVVCKDDPDALALLAEGLREDFDGSGPSYVPELTLWHVVGATGATIYLAASLLDPCAVLMSTDLDFMKGMLAFEILQRLQGASLSVEDGRRKAQALGIEIEVQVNEDGEQSITFFGHSLDKERIVGKLFVFEPIEYALR